MDRPVTTDNSFENSPESWKNMADDKTLVLMPSPCNIIVASPTHGGKSTFVYRLLKHDLFRDTPEKILYCYNSSWQPMFSRLESVMSNITFHYGMPSRTDMEEFQQTTTSHKAIILDDLMTDSVNSDSVLKLFTIGMHHNNCTVILLTHNLFPKSKHGRTINLNCQVFVLMSNCRDKAQVQTLGRQLGYARLLDAYVMACKDPYSHFVIDLHNDTPSNLRLRSSIFPDDPEPTTIYKAE